MLTRDHQIRCFCHPARAPFSAKSSGSVDGTRYAALFELYFAARVDNRRRGVRLDSVLPTRWLARQLSSLESTNVSDYYLAVKPRISGLAYNPLRGKFDGTVL
jgi:hypothetical protein